MMNRADQFQQAFRNLQLQPLITEEDRRMFRVPYGEELLPELEQIITDCTNANNQLIFAGHRGCGKSTLLATLAQEIKDRYFMVFFSIADLIELPKIDHINILYAIAVQLMDAATDKELKIPPDKLKSFFDWFKKRARIETEEKKAGVAAGFDFKIFKGQLQADASIKDETRTEFQQNLKELTDAINLIAVEIKLACRQEIVVIIDDIDKVGLAQIEDIFLKNIKPLLQPQFIVIYTVPIATIRDGALRKHIEDETGNSIYLMPVQKLYEYQNIKSANPIPVAATMTTLREILFKRVDQELFAADISDRIIRKSGGLLRELVRITQECCRLVRTQMIVKQRSQQVIDDLLIDTAILDQALSNLQNAMEITLSKSDRDILATIYRNSRPDDPKQQEFLDLLHNTYTIECRNGKSWYMLHPLILEQLCNEGVISV